MPKKELDDYIKAHPHKIGNANEEPNLPVNSKTIKNKK